MTEVKIITSPSGRIWMDRNWGAIGVGDRGDYYSHEEALQINMPGFRVPTDEEWQAEIDADGIEFLNLPLAGQRFYPFAGDYAKLTKLGTHGHYQSSSVGGGYTRYLLIYPGFADLYNGLGAGRFSVRLIKI